jgi:hypothetical protein
MTVPEPHRSPTAPKDREWNWHGSAEAKKTDALIDPGGWAAMANAHAWYEVRGDEEDPPRRKAAYKLPHHELVGGELKVVWRGVAAAMQVLNGARGGAEMPDGDRAAVHRHLAAHYAQFDEEPPDLA